MPYLIEELYFQIPKCFKNKKWEGGNSGILHSLNRRASNPHLSRSTFFNLSRLRPPPIPIPSQVHQILPETIFNPSISLLFPLVPTVFLDPILVTVPVFFFS